MPEIRLINVTKRYGRIIANESINLTIKNGEYVSVIGPSGCGKTTLIKSIAGIIRPDEGEIYIDDRLVNNLAIEDREVGYVFQNIALFPHMTVWDNITYGPKVKGVSPEETRPLALEMLEMNKLSERATAYPHELSGGTQQKTAVARALVSRAKLLLLDEPLGALDVKVRTKLRYELRRLVKDLQLTALHVTHDQEEAMSISDRVIVMKKGRIVEAGTPIKLYTEPKNLFTANFVGEVNIISGVIIKASSSGSIVDLGEGLQLTTSNQDREEGERVVIAFRPEFTLIGDDEEQNRLFGTISDVIYSGSVIRIKIMLRNGTQVVSKTLAHERNTLTINRNVTISVHPNNILIYPFPKESLFHELALE